MYDTRLYQLVTCIKLDDGSWYLRGDPDLECYVGDHLTVLLAAGVPATVLWVVGVPALAMFLLYRHAHAPDQQHGGLDDEHVVHQLGFLYLGMRR